MTTVRNNERVTVFNFIQDNCGPHEITYKHTVTRATDPTLRYEQVDSYTVKCLSSALLSKLVEMVDTLKNVELYFCFDTLCVGYLDRVYGNIKRLDAFVRHDLTAATQDLDKEFVIPGKRISHRPTDKEFVNMASSARAQDLDKVGSHI